MGSFSFLKADDLTKTANIYSGLTYKLLIPEEYGGGFIKDTYGNYGIIVDKNNIEYDIFELLAFWNRDILYDSNSYVIEHLKYDPEKYNFEFPKKKFKDEFTESNRLIGTTLFHKRNINSLKYPLKLVSASFKGSYKDCKGISFPDPFQGFGNLSREKFKKEYPSLYEKWNKYYN